MNSIRKSGELRSDKTRQGKADDRRRRLHRNISHKARQEPVGISSIGWWLPHGRVTAGDIAAAAGIDEETLTAKMGFNCKRIAGPDDHPSDMAVRAARDAFQKHRLEPDDVDLIVFATEGPVDWQGWSIAASVQNRLGIHHAFAFEIHNACCGANAGMTLAAGLMHRDAGVETALILTAVRAADLIDYGDPAVHGLWMLGDGATATVLRRDEPSNYILAYAEITEPGTADLVTIPLGGTRMPFSPDPGLADFARYRVSDGEKLDHTLKTIYLEKYIEVIRMALSRCGHTPDDISFLLTNQISVPLMDQIMDRLDLARDKTLRSIDFAGHIGPGDTVMNLGRALGDGLVGKGDLVVLATSGLGFSWGATVIQWK